ncbi:MAG: hypothetical protein V2I34_06510 [Bacteroidales bacterium]|jgi:hypothetical protein|nr:hypothetical protein [Bacteroidales bacterium]
MRKRILNNTLLIAALASIFILGGCEKDKTEGPSLGVEFEAVKIGTFLSDQSKALNGELVINSGTILFESVEFEAESENELVEIEFELEGDVLFDFETVETTPDISSIAVPAGTYEEIEIELEIKDGGDTPSIVMEGVYTDQESTEHPFRFEYNADQTFEVEMEGSIVFEADVSFIALVTIDPASWFSEVTDNDMTSATKNEDNLIVISSTSNVSIYNTVSAGLELASEVEFEIEGYDDM